MALAQSLEAHSHSNNHHGTKLALDTFSRGLGLGLFGRNSSRWQAVVFMVLQGVCVWVGGGGSGTGGTAVVYGVFQSCQSSERVDCGHSIDEKHVVQVAIFPCSWHTDSSCVFVEIMQKVRWLRFGKPLWHAAQGQRPGHTDTGRH